MEEAKFRYFLLVKAFEKQIKIIEEQGKKYVEVLKVLKAEENKEGIKSVEGIFPKEMRTNEIKNEIDDFKKWGEKLKTKDLIYKANKYKFEFQQYEIIRSFSESISTGTVNISEAEIDQSSLLKCLVEFSKRSRPKIAEGKDKKNTSEKVNALFEGQELILNASKSGILSIKETQGKGLKILTPKQMLQRLLIALAQVKAGNTSENLLNEIRQIIYFLYLAK